MDNIQEQIAQLSLKQFSSLPKTGKPNDNEWTVLSCIVKEQNSTLEVISLGTGSKCIGKSKMCPKGTIVNDGHAEVMCRRAFLRYLYSQLRKDSLFLDFDLKSLKFTLKPNIKFHFFTSHVPCGDAAIFPKNYSDDFGDVIQINSDEVPTKKRKIEDIFRTGAKCLKDDVKQDIKGEGKDYHVVGVVRTKPGRGDPTESVSCSDKLAKWCHLGIQGALLMQFLENPIYLSSFTILNETAFCSNALERALFRRLENVELIAPYMNNILNIHRVDLPFTYKKVDGRHPCSSSIAWFKKDEKSLEVAVNGRKQGVTKKHYLTEKGRLKICKLELFKMFIQKAKEFNIVIVEHGDIEKITYGKAKGLSKSYQNNWNILKKKIGIWTSKDPALLEFLAT